MHSSTVTKRILPIPTGKIENMSRNIWAQEGQNDPFVDNVNTGKFQLFLCNYFGFSFVVSVIFNSGP